jgi:hypothetical protein
LVLAILYALGTFLMRPRGVTGFVCDLAFLSSHHYHPPP